MRRNALDLTIENLELITRVSLQPHDLQAWLDVLKVTGNQLKHVVHEIHQGAEKQRESGHGTNPGEV